MWPRWFLSLFNSSPKFHQVSNESTHRKSWVTERVGLGCGLGMTYPHHDSRSTMARGTSPAPCPKLVADLPGSLLSGQDNHIAYILERDLHVVEVTGNLQYRGLLCLAPLVRQILGLVSKALRALCNVPSGFQRRSDKVIRCKAVRVTACT